MLLLIVRSRLWVYLKLSLGKLISEALYSSVKTLVVWLVGPLESSPTGQYRTSFVALRLQLLVLVSRVRSIYLSRDEGSR